MNVARIERLVGEVCRLTIEEVVELRRQLSVRFGDGPGSAGVTVSVGSGPQPGLSGAATMSTGEMSGVATVATVAGRVVETSGSASFATGRPSCASCGTDRVNLCRFDADVAAGRMPKRRPHGCLLGKKFGRLENES